MTAPAEPPGAAEEPFAHLLEVAWQLAARAYAPYSGYAVGAAALVDDGRTVSGCNVENAAYGVALCAECGLISELIAGGGGRLVAFACVNGAGQVIMPCGRCRQLLSEHAAAELQVLTPRGVLGMHAILPQAFGADDIEEMRDHDRDR
ncbi:cytidine deaminase [Brachybacterium sp. UNK5269]|uniref:cytidine deaminase n=1 Tax=Brachybacterium sp. UNK5269 TaxID=3408576 RepID=UPI003BB10C27